MIELRPAATAAWSPSGAWSAMSRGQAALTAALQVPSTTVAAITAPNEGAKAKTAKAAAPSTVPAEMVDSAPKRPAMRPHSPMVTAVLP